MLAFNWINQYDEHLHKYLIISLSRYLYHYLYSYLLCLCKQRQMIEVKPSISLGRQPNVDHMIGAWYKANESSNKKYNTLWCIVWIGDGKGAHHKQSGADDEQRKGGQHSAPILTHLWMPPAICVCLLCGQVPIFLDKWIAVPWRCVFRIFIVAPDKKIKKNGK